MSPRCLPSSFGSIWLTVWEEMWSDEFHGGHLGYWNRMILAILNFHNTPMPPIKFKLNHLPFGSRCDLKIFKMAKMAAMGVSWISERNHFSNSKSQCCPDAFHQVSALSDLWFRSRQQLKTFKTVAMRAIMDTILMEMSKMWKVTDRHTDEGQTTA